MGKRRRRLTAQQEALKHILACRDKKSLEGRFIDSFKGRGLFTHETIEPSAFVVEYRGNISHKGTTTTNNCGYTLNKYLFEFSWEGAQWCVDASGEDGTLGRLVNDDNMSPNCEMKTIVYEGKPHLCLFAATQISPGKEITFNYGDSSYPWRSGASLDGSSSSNSDAYATSSAASTLKREYLQASCFKSSCSDNKDKKRADSRQSHGTAAVVDINGQMDFSANSTTSKKMSMAFMLQPDEASCSQRDESPSGCDDEHRPSKATANPKGTSQSLTNYCYICGKGVRKGSRHILKHADEDPLIAEAMALPETSEERKRLLRELCERNYQHDQKVFKFNSAELKRTKQRKTLIGARTQVHCLHCDGMFARKEMRRHVARCHSRTKHATGGKTRLLKKITLAGSSFSKKPPAGVRKVLSGMKKDEISFAVQNDFLLMELAVCLCDRYGNDPSKHEHIRQKLREMGRLLLALHKKSIFSVEDAVRGQNFYEVVETVKDVSGFEEKMQSYKKPSLVLRLGNLLKRLCKIVLTGVDRSDEMMRDTKAFMELFEQQWTRLVSRTALAALSGQKDEAEDHTPPTSENNGPSLVQEPMDGPCTRQEDQSDHSFDDSISEEEAKDPPLPKKDYCYICGLAQSKISHHLLTHKKEEPDISALQKLRKNSKERKDMLEILRNRGNYLHHREVLKTGCRGPKVRRHSLKNVDAVKTFASCIYCENLYTCQELSRHMQRCPAKKLYGPRSVNIKPLTSVEAVESTDILNLSPGVRKMLSTLRKDELSAEVLNDSLLMQLAQFWYPRAEGRAGRLEYIKKKLRQMGRLLLTLKEKSICSLEDAVKPQNFSKLVEAVRELSGYNEVTKSYEKPGLLTHLEDSLKKIGEINSAVACKGNSGSEAIRDAETFMTLCKKEWNWIHLAISDKTATLPFIRDVQLYYQFMENTAASAVESLTLYESFPVYTALLRVTVAQVSVLNKNIAQVSQATLKSFRDWAVAERGAAAGVVQSQFEQILSKSTTRIKVRNGRGQKVPVTLTPKLLAAITLLAEKREACGVHKNNPFLFGIPNAPCTSFFHGHRCTFTFSVRCGAKNRAVLRSPLFHKHVAKVFQILGLASDELHQLGELLGRRIPTDTEYYQTPEAVGDIAKISELLSALENGSLNLFEGKSLEEIKVPDEFEPDVEQHKPEDGDAEEDGEEDGEESRGSSLSGSPLAKSPFSEPKRNVGGSLLRKRGRGRRKWQAKESDASELDKEQNEEVNAERDAGSEEKPQGMVTRSNKNATNNSFSDDDGMNVDSDMDTDEDVVRDQEHGDNGDASDSPATALKPNETKQDNDSADSNEEEDCSPDKPPTETMDINTANNVEEEDRKKGGKRIKLSPAVTGMKQLMILIPKLDILETPVHIHQLASQFHPVESLVKEQSIGCDETSSIATNVKDRPHDAKVSKMSCSRCNKSLMKGHTAYQKKGFMDIFCSKKCLHKRFPIIKPVTKTCHQCLKVISQPLDLIVAAVDNMGTRKDFCSQICLLYFKYISGFAGGKIAACGNCSTAFCHKPLKLKLENKAKTVCSQKCLDELKENIKTPHQCTMCQTSLAVSDMLDFKSGKNEVELFCSRTCVKSYRLRPGGPQDFQAGSDCSDLPKKKRAKPTIQIIAAEKMKRMSTAMPTLILADSWVVCCNCGKKVPRGATLHQTKSTQEVFCSAECLSEKHPNAAAATKTCYSCFQEIIRPHSMILAPVDGSGAMKELCSPTCLASVNSKRNAAASKPRPAPGSRSECRMCNKFCFCKFNQTLDGRTQKICSDACYVNYHRINNVPTSICDVCRSIGRAAFTLKPEDGSKDICSQECLVKFKEKIEMLRLCHVCQTPHQLSDMVENKNNKGMLDFFCSNRCMLVHNARSSTVPESKRPSPEENDIQEVKPSLTDWDFIKEEPIDEEYDQKLPSSISTEGIKAEPKAGDDVPMQTKTLQPCAMCSASHLKSDMIENKNSEGATELFCTISCVMASKIRAVNASGSPLDCDKCGKTTLPACHLAMPDASIRSFCTLTCAMSFKEKQRDTNVSTNSTGAADQSLRLPEELPCSQCQRVIKTTPKVIQKKGKMSFVCSLACSEEFKTANHIIGQCEYCKNETIIRDIKKVEGKACYFCSDGCKRLFQHQLQSQWGEHCASCVYCSSISKTRVTAQHEGTDEDFCSADCSANYNMLLSCAAQCDTCGHSGELSQSLPLLGEVKHFCDLRCLLHFCKKKIQMVDTVSSPRSSGTVESRLVITNVISLASATQHVPGVHRKDVGQASVQTAPRQLKNKSVLCTPLVHNKGVSCTTRTVDTESQTDDCVPKVIVLPVPVPMYVPLPLNMYSQYTPTPLCLPVPLPVPVFLPDPTVRSAEEEMQPEGDLNTKAEMTEVKDKRNERDGRVASKKRRRQEIHGPSDHSSNHSDALDSDHEEDFSSDTSFRSPSRPNIKKNTCSSSFSENERVSPEVTEN